MPPLLYYTLKFASEYTPSKRICSAEPFNSDFLAKATPNCAPSLNKASYKSF